MAAEAVSGHWRSRYGRLREGYRGLKRALEVTSRALASAGVRLESAAAAVTEESLTADESGSLRLCIVCFAEPFTHAFLPCGHRCVCSRWRKPVPRPRHRADRELRAGPAAL